MSYFSQRAQIQPLADDATLALRRAIVGGGILGNRAAMSKCCTERPLPVS